jgi:hypothetical protein
VTMTRDSVSMAEDATPQVPFEETGEFLQRGEAVPLLPGLDVHGVGSGELAYHLGVATELRDALRMRGAKTELLQTKK